MNDISPNFTYNATDARILKKILPHEATPQAIVMFSKQCHQLSNYGYWFVLGTLWVSYSGHSDLNLWRNLFTSDRPSRSTSLMKPTEHLAFNGLPAIITAYRAHRENESDWISYTLNPDTAGRFAAERNVTRVSKYRICKVDVRALFTRRGEQELLVLDRDKAVKFGDIPVC